MSGYSRLADYYGALFPLSEAHKAFLSGFAGHANDAYLPWLDVGCGTGALLEWLTAQGVDAYGLEPDVEFAESARETVGAGRVRVGGMDHALTPPGPYGAISCLGNVLAHAADLEQMADFLQSASDALVPGGRLIVQIVNYDRVLAADSWEFPILRKTASDGAELTFHRYYDLTGRDAQGRLRFDTELSVNNRKVANSVWLTPALKEELANLVEGVYEESSFFGDFTGVAWDVNSPAAIAVCRKSS